MPMDMKAKIGETLSQLLCRKPLDKITVKELVDTCGISRQTFYYHFQDIMDVVEWNQRQSLRQAIEASLAAPTGRDAIRGIVSESVKRREQIRQLLSSQRGREIEQLLCKVSGANDILLAYINSRVGQLDEERRQLQTEAERLAHQEGTAAILNPAQLWTKASFAQKQAVADALIEIIKVADGEIEIVWKI